MKKYVQVIDFEDYTTYTFKIERETNTPNLLENYTVKVVDGTIIEHYLMQYPYELNAITGEKNFLNNEASMITLENPSWIPQARLGCPHGTVPILVEAQTTYTTISVNCSGENHPPGDPLCKCEKTDPCKAGYTYQQPNTVYTWGCNGGSNNDGNTNGSTSGLGNGGSSSNTGSNNNNTTTTVPFDDARGRAKECKKITTAISTSTNNPNDTLETYRNKLATLATQVSDVNNENNEKGIYLTPTNSVGYTAPGFTVSFLRTINYKVISHTHNNDPDGKYSVFSFEDLIGFSELLKHGKINETDFVATLSTSKGTHYALTLGDVEKFKSFFYAHNNDSNPSNTLQWMNIWNKMDLIKKKYYDHETNPLIKQTDTDNNRVLGYFLDMMNEADLGIALFKTDANFSTFTRITKDKTTGQIKEEICN